MEKSKSDSKERKAGRTPEREIRSRRRRLFLRDRLIRFDRRSLFLSVFGSASLSSVVKGVVTRDHCSRLVSSLSMVCDMTASFIVKAKGVNCLESIGNPELERYDS